MHRVFFQHFFGKDKQVLVRKFELGDFLRELDQFWAELDPFWAELEHFMSELGELEQLLAQVSLFL